MASKESPEPLNIFNYSDPSLFLRDQWLIKKLKNKSFSIRSWSQNLGIKSHSQLHQMLYGKRSIPIKYLPSIAKNLALSKKEAEYFESLLSIQKSKTGEEKQFYFEKIKSFAKKGEMIFEEIEHYEMIRNPLNYFLIEFLQLKKRSRSLEQIKQNLYFSYSTLEIKRSIETLLRLGVIVEIAPGEYAKSKRHFYTKNDIPSEAIRTHHKIMAEIAKQAIDLQDVEQREFSSTTINIKRSDVSRAKELIREFREKFILDMGCDPKKANETYQLNLNFFAVTKPGDEK